MLLPPDDEVATLVPPEPEVAPAELEPLTTKRWSFFRLLKTRLTIAATTVAAAPIIATVVAVSAMHTRG